MPKLSSNLWWEESDKFRAQSIVESVKSIRDINGFDRQADAAMHMRVYGGKAYSGLEATDYFKSSSALYSGNEAGRLRFNVTKMACDAIHARISKNKPAPMFLTDGGDYGILKQAKRLSQFVKGVFYNNKAYRVGTKVFLDAEILGTAAIKVYLKGERVCIERCFPWEIDVDPVESVYGEPQNFFQTKFIDRRVLMAAFREHEDSIATADGEKTDYAFADNATNDVLKVYEAWHLPSEQGKEGPKTDGLHTICVENTVLFEEPYTRKRPPFVFINWDEPRIGFWGKGLVEELLPIQLEINKLLQSVQQNHHLGSRPMVLIERGSKIEDGHINNQPFSIVHYTNSPPQVVTWQTTHPEIYGQIETLAGRAFEIARISKLSSSGQIPAGIQGSGRSMLVYNDIESEGFSEKRAIHEQMFMDTTEHIIDLAKSAYQDGVDLEVQSVTERRSKKFLETIKWSEVNLEDGAYQMQLMPVSSLPDTPAGKLAYLQELTQLAPIDEAHLLRLLDLPDTASYTNLKTASMDVIYESIETMLEDGTYVSPEPFDDPNEAARLGRMSYHRAKLDGVPEDRLQILIDYIEAATAMIPQPTEAAGAPMPGASPQTGLPVMPGGNGAMPPDMA